MTVPTISFASTAGFLNSIGVNTHIGLGTGGYSSPDQIRSSLSYLGINDIRDAFAATGNRAAMESQLADAGVHFDFIVTSDLPGYGNAAAARWVSGVSAFQQAHVGSVAFVEGLNEPNTQAFSYNGSSSLAAAASFQQYLYGLVKSDPTLQATPVIAPALSHDQPDDYTALGTLSSSADYANSHAYAPPFVNSPSAIISTLLGHAAAVVPNAPVLVTETGATTYASDPDVGVSELGQARIMLTDLLNNYANGVGKTYLYELFDSYAPGASSEKEHHFGLFNADGSAKAAATAVHNLTTILSQPPAVVSGGDAPTIEALPANVHALVLQAGNGNYNVALWRDGAVWNVNSQQDVSSASQWVTVDLGGDHHSAAAYDVIQGVNAVQTVTDSSHISVALGADPLVIQISRNPILQTNGVGEQMSALVRTDSNSNVLNGSDLADTIRLGAGNNFVTGGGGADRIMVGDGNNHVYGYAQPGVTGSADGADIITVGSGTNVVNGNGGNDLITAGALGSTGNNRLWGGQGDDYIVVLGGGRNAVNGNLGNDAVNAADATGNNLLRGGQGDDSLFAGHGYDQLMGDSGNDTLHAGTGNVHWSVLTGGSGADTFDFSAAGSAQAGIIGGNTFYQEVTDFEPGSDHLQLAFTPSVADLGISGDDFKSFDAAHAWAEQTLAAHGGVTGVAAAQVGNDTYLFFADANGTDPATSVVKLDQVSATALHAADFGG